VSHSEEPDAEKERKLGLAAKLKMWAGKADKPQETTPTKSVGEIWYLLNTALGINDPNHSHHPALIIGVEDDTIFVLKGTSDPTRHRDAVAVHPNQCEGRLRGSTYFCVDHHQPVADTDPVFGRYIGKVKEDALARIREYRKQALAEPKS
jgi:hypothetical protein